MTNEEAIEELMYLKHMVREDSNADMALDIAIEALKVLPSAQPEQQWIPCSERLPSEDAYYLVTLGNGIAEDGQDIEMCAWADGHWDWWNSDLVLAWMLQPEPWKGEQNE